MATASPRFGKAFSAKYLATRLRTPRRRIVSKNRFDSRHCPDLTPDAQEFGTAMTAYLAHKARDRATWTPGEVLDVLCDLGYRNAEKNFEVCVHRFATAIARLKRGTKRKSARIFPTWSEVLGEALLVGWYRKHRPI